MTGRRPTVLVDQDGPLADFDNAVYDLCAELDIPMHEGAVNRAHPCTQHRFLSDCLSSRDANQLRHVIEKSRWFLDLPLVAGSVDGMNELLEQADVWICTKPLETNEYCRDDKAAWIRRHLGPAWERRLILAPHKGMVLGDILLDDAPKHAWLPRATWRPVMYTMPWNQAGSIWDGLPHWSWGQPIRGLLQHVPPPIAQWGL